MVKPPILSYDALRTLSEAFLAKHWPAGTIPVDIEHIVDVKLGLDIISVEGLQKRIGVEGYLSRDRTAIYVDEHVQTSVPVRYRFTLAHEIAHWELHRDLYVQAEFTTPEEWLAFQASIAPEDLGWFEFQGNSFGGLLLAPTEPLRIAFEGAIELAAQRGVSVDLGNEVHRDVVANTIARDFHVSRDVILKRGRKEGFWPSD